MLNLLQKGANLTAFPRSYLLADPSLAEWHNLRKEGAHRLAHTNSHHHSNFRAALW